MEVLFISGVSGAGKSSAMDVLEDLNYYCVDNMPQQLFPTFIDLIRGAGYEKVAVATDVRGIDTPASFANTAALLKNKGIDFKIIFLECGDAELLKRFRLSRRRHPLMQGKDNSIEKAIDKERELLSPIRGAADYLIDTTFLKPAQLKERLVELLSDSEGEGMRIYCMSFGFKHGTPTEADLMFDVRCLPNPYYVEGLKEKTGLEEEVRTYVMQNEHSVELLKKFTDLTAYLIPLYEAEGKSQLVIAFGCSGGHHRSVTFAEKLAEALREKGFAPIVSHRDIEKV